MKCSVSLIFLFLLLISGPSCINQKSGSKDSDLLDINIVSNEDGVESNNQMISRSVDWSIDLDPGLSESSGLLYLDGLLWTHNDDTDTRLYLLDPFNGEIVGEYELPGVKNQDWEEITYDDAYIYIGDFGNNMGNRDNLHILRVDRSSLSSGIPYIDSISFTYSDQTSLDFKGLNQSEFDCEAFVVGTDSIYLFSKQWQTGYTTQYVLPKTPGIHVALKRDSYSIQGLVTGATLIEDKNLLVLCGYTGFTQPFLYLFYNFNDDAFFSGRQKRVNLELPFHQIEAIHSSDGINFYLTNEQLKIDPHINIRQQLHMVSLNESFKEFTGEY